MEERLIGVVEHYYPRRKAAVVRLDQGELHVGDTILIRGRGIDMLERVLSMEIEHEPVVEASSGLRVGVELTGPAPAGARVFVARPEFVGDTY